MRGERQDREHTDAATASPGQILRRAREGFGLEVDDVATELHLSATQIRALEDDNYSDMPGETYVRGYLRGYARLVNVDESQVLAPIDEQEPDAAAEPESAPPPGATRTRRRGGKWLAFAVLVLVVGSFAVWWQGRQAGPVDGSPAGPGTGGGAVSARGPSVSPGRAVKLQHGHRLTLQFDDTSWVDIRDASGRRLLYQTFPRGRSTEVSGSPPFHVFLSNAGGVRMAYDGKPVDIESGKSGIFARFTLSGPDGNGR